MAKYNKPFWTEPERDILRRHYQANGGAWCALFLAASGFPERTRTAVAQAARLMGLAYEGPAMGQFRKGFVPANKGQKMSAELRAKVAHTFFQKGSLHGQAAHNKKPIGAESLRDDGYVYVKIAERKWIQKQRSVWEKHHGPVPEGHVVRFRDGNPHNCHPDNLELVSRGEHATRCRWDQPTTYNLITDSAAKVWLKKKGFRSKQITPELLQMAKVKTLIHIQRRKK